MTFHIEELRLCETYKFDVNVSDGTTHFAGTLLLSPDQCLLTVMGEVTSDRRCNIRSRETEELRCSDQNKTFILRNLTLSHDREKVVTGQPKRIIFFRKIFHIEYVVFMPADHVVDDSFDRISVFSDSISSWVGNTTTQEAIIHRYKSVIERPDNLTEFVQEIDNKNAKIGITYNLSLYHSSPSFNAGMTFPPSLDMVFPKGVPLSEIASRYWQLYNLFAFLIGSDFVPEKVKIGRPLSAGSKSCSLYFCTQHFRASEGQNIVVFPLGSNLRFDEFGLPPFPLKAFTNYFNLSEADLSIWRKYCLYKRMENAEDRFLGFFRLLERMCFKEAVFLDENKLKNIVDKSRPYLIKRFEDRKNVNSLLRMVLRSNKRKYNVAKCIQDFYALLPGDETSRWKFSKRSIERTCNIRNDIAHRIMLL